MDARQTAAERAAADQRAVRDDAARADAMRQSAAIHERDAKAEKPEKDDQVVTTFRGQKVVTREEAAEIVLAEKLEAAEKELGDDGLWYILIRVFKPDSLLRLLANRKVAIERASLAPVVPETDAEKKAREEREADETPAEAKARKDRDAAAKKAADVDFVPEPVPVDETDVQKKLRIERDRVRKASGVKAPGADTAHYLHDAIVEATCSDNRP